MSRIVEVRPFMVNFQQGTGGDQARYGGRGNMLIVRIRTDDGIEGFGEGTLPHKTRAVAGAVEDFAEYLVGQDDSLIERHWQVLYRNSFQRGGVILMTAQSAIDQALWDIAGKRFGVPVWRLMGGAVRDRILLYTHPGGSSREEIVDRTHQRVEEGYRAFKYGIPGTPEWISDRKAVEATYENIAAVRDAVGDDMKIMVDAHGKQTPTVAIEIVNALEPLDLLFFEEPVPPRNVDAMLLVTAATNVPLATGERMYNRWDFRTTIESQAVAVLQPDLGHAGGISETRRIAAAAETYFMGIAPHNPRGPGVTLASLHIAACTPNFIIQESSIPIGGDALWDEMLVEPLTVKDGYVDLPQAPGHRHQVRRVDRGALSVRGPRHGPPGARRRQRRRLVGGTSHAWSRCERDGLRRARRRLLLPCRRHGDPLSPGRRAREGGERHLRRARRVRPSLEGAGRHRRVREGDPPLRGGGGREDAGRGDRVPRS